MEFASSVVLNNEEEEYECISDDEFHGGMELSGSSSESGEDGMDSSSIRPPKRARRRPQHHWRQNLLPPPKSTDGVKDAKRWFRKADTNVVSVSFDTLMSPGSMHAGDPVICNTCQAILSHISKPVMETENMVWKCEFCSNSMVIDIVPEEIPAAEEVTFLMEAGQAMTSSTLSGRDESIVVFCVDTSGSMCVTSEVDGKVKLRGNSQLHRLDSFNTEGSDQFLPSQKKHDVTYISRLQAMQAAVDHQLGEMAKNFPHRRVALVTFSNDVTVIGDGYQEEITVAGDKLVKMDQLAEIGSKVPSPQAIQKCHKRLGEKVYKLEEGGATALGPALIVAINLAASHAGSKVIICTDGKANIGLGKLEDEADEQDETEFYTGVGDSAVSKGVSISVTTIRGTDCKLVHLGQLADKTGGQVNIVDPLNLTKEFGNILADKIIATNVKSKFLVHKALYVIDDNNPDSQQCLAEFSPGNVKSSTAITFEFARRPKDKDKESQEVPVGEKAEEDNERVYDNPTETADVIYDNPKQPEMPETDTAEGAGAMVCQPQEDASKNGVSESISEFPFQLQIEYIDTEGTKALRVITRALPATADRRMAEHNANLEVLGTHAAKKSADLALQGEYTKSRGKALMNQRLAWRSSHNDTSSSSKKSKYRNIYTKLKSMENQLKRKQTQEILSRGRTYSDDSDDEEDDGADATDGALYSNQPMATNQLCCKEKKKKQGRYTEMDDSFANMAYNFRRVSTRDMTADETPPPLPPPRSPRK